MLSKIAAPFSYLKKGDPGFTELASAICDALYEQVKSVLGPRCNRVLDFSMTSEVNLLPDGKYLVVMQAFFWFTPTRATMRRFGIPRAMFRNIQRMHATGELSSIVEGDPTNAAFDLANLLLSNLVHQHDNLESAARSVTLGAPVAHSRL